MKYDLNGKQARYKANKLLQLRTFEYSVNVIRKMTSHKAHFFNCHAKVRKLAENYVTLLL